MCDEITRIGAITFLDVIEKLRGLLGAFPRSRANPGGWISE